MKLALALHWIFIGAIALKASAEMTMTNVQVQNCTQLGDICITVKSPNVQVSGIQMIFYMKQVEIEVKNLNSGEPTEKFQRQSGVLDFDSNQLVLNSFDANGTLIEEVYNLKTLQKQISKRDDDVKINTAANLKALLLQGQWTLLLVLFSTVIGLTGCQPKETIIEKHYGPNQPDTLPAPPSSENPSGGIDGGGGGNGFGGESLEHWRMDLKTLPSYQLLKEKIIDKLSLRFPKLAGDLLHLTERRRWYLIPTELRNLPGAKIGVFFDTQQIALQGLEEVWINELIFSKMSLDSQTTLIMHELLMGVRLLAFASNFDLCLANISHLKLKPENEGVYSEERHQCFKKYRDISEVDDSIGLGKEIKLEDFDYFSIRLFTSTLMNDVETFNVQELSDEMRIRKFRNYSP